MTSKDIVPGTLPSIVQALNMLDRLRDEIANARNFEELDKKARTAKAIHITFEPVKEVSDRAGEVWIEAECRMAEELAKLPKAKGGQPYQKKSTGSKMEPVEPTLEELGINKKRSAKAAKLSAIPKKKLKKIIAKLKEEDKPINPNSILSAQRKEVKETKKHQTSIAKFSANGPFDVIVIDPPWPMKKIDRDVRPNQDAFDYPTMTYEELDKWWDEEMVETGKIAEDCHLFCWTTQKFLPMAKNHIEGWGFKYILLLVWHKPGGFQPIGLPQYNCEFAIYARKGKPEFIDTKNFFCCFEAPRGKHSEKPDIFYETIKRVTGGSRVDIFSRRKHDGFASYGNQMKDKL